MTDYYKCPNHSEVKPLSASGGETCPKCLWPENDYAGGESVDPNEVFGFDLVNKDEERSPLHRVQPRNCNHDKVYTSDKYPVKGLRYICANCGSGTTHPSDFD